MTKQEEQTPVPQLNSKQKKFLKGLGHSLTPVVAIGKEGLSNKIKKATILELGRHELIKVKLGKSCPVERKETAAQLSADSGSALVQIIGKTFLLYKKNPELDREKQLKLPS